MKKWKGVVVFIDTEHGIGTIRDRNEQEIGFLLSDECGQLQVGNAVEYQIELGKDGLSAVQVKLVQEAESVTYSYLNTLCIKPIIK